MQAYRIGILEPDGFSTKAREQLHSVAQVSDYNGGDLASFLADKQALFVRLKYMIDGTFLDHARALRHLCSPTTGLTHLDQAELSRRDIGCMTLAGETEFLEGIRATPEHTIGLMLALLRNYRTAFLDGKNDHWDRDRCRGVELARTSVGLIGFGRVGRRVASYLQAFEANVGWYDPNVQNPSTMARRFATIEELIAASQVVVLAASWRPGSPPVLDRTMIGALGEKYFINIARGELVDDEALIGAIESGRLAGCAVDVIANELDDASRRRWLAATRFTNVIVTPHIGGATFTSMRATEEFLARKLIDVLSRQ
jgi:D-3-phosphoglycerate dehydrogenase